eukprot:2401615-Rhodomonas_salina.2
MHQRLQSPWDADPVNTADCAEAKEQGEREICGRNQIWAVFFKCLKFEKLSRKFAQLTSVQQ